MVLTNSHGACRFCRGPLSELVDLGMQDGIIERAGDYYSATLDDGRVVKCHGVKRFVAQLKDDDQLYNELLELVTLNSSDGR